MMTRFALGVKCGRLGSRSKFRPDARADSASSEPSAMLPNPDPIRSNNARRVSLGIKGSLIYIQEFVAAEKRLAHVGIGAQGAIGGRHGLVERGLSPQKGEQPVEVPARR